MSHNFCHVKIGATAKCEALGLVFYFKTVFLNPNIIFFKSFFKITLLVYQHVGPPALPGAREGVDPGAPMKEGRKVGASI